MTTFIKHLINKDTVVLDTRHPFSDINDGLIKGSINISIKAPFSIWAGYLLHPDDPIVVIGSENKEKEAISRLLRIGFRNVYGFLEGGIINYVSNYKSVLAELKREDLINDLSLSPLNIIQVKYTNSYVYNSEFKILDVREPSEHQIGYFPNSLLLPLSTLKSKIQELNKNENYYILCKTGVRASMAYSILISLGFDSSKLHILEGGLTKLKEKGIKL